MRVTSFLKKDGLIIGVKVSDAESGRHYKFFSKAVINATGIFSDHLRKIDNKCENSVITPSQGIHLVLPKTFMPSQSAILIPHTDDGRVIFLVPWHNRVLVGTTDTAMKTPLLEPHALCKEIKFLLKHASRYLNKDPSEADILSIFAGMRPLVKSGDAKNTAAISRDHTILISHSGLITIAGGKWTTYRKMAQDVIDKAILVGHLPEHSCMTKTLRLHGYKEGLDPCNHWSTYGTDAKEIRALMRKYKSLAKKIHPKLPYYRAEIIWAVRNEMARSVEDILSRRTRALLLDAKASLQAAPIVARMLAKELKKKPSWINQQIEAYARVAKNYIP
jgi:glycerol-3-phosphate dehydrogenase